MGIAYRVARDGLARGQSIKRIYSEIRQTASFAGSMRTSLIDMLNELYLPSVLGVSSGAARFDVQHYVTHTTSAIRYPVFVDGENYTGHHPRILKHAKLKEFNRHALCGRGEASFRGSGYSCGRAGSQALEYWVLNKQLEAERCLLDFPHPSGSQFRILLGLTDTGRGTLR